MAVVKTAISLDERLLADAESAAREMKLSRSGIVARALQDYLRRRETQRITESWNEAYADGLDDDERMALEGMRAIQRRISERETW